MAGVITNLDLRDWPPFIQRAFVTGTFQERAAGWEHFWSDPGYRTVLGNGIGSLWAGVMKFGTGTAVPHNGVIQFMYELGGAGTMLFFITWGMLLLRWRRFITRGGAAPPLALIAMGFMCGVMVSNASVAEVFQLRQIAVPFWLMAGLVVTGASEEPEP